ncbi:hypothetical protein [Metabacillus fastidiosus]|uniref:hypothetical protein n=2 Tax=Metabacillus fastidiosus TaxID=1458 RepID=UPI002E233A58|nr:hypothetical protein [Metabacillus fastidiosus]
MKKRKNILKRSWIFLLSLFLIITIIASFLWFNPFNIHEMPVVHFGYSKEKVEKASKWKAIEVEKHNDGLPTNYYYVVNSWNRDGIQINYLNDKVNNIIYGFDDPIKIKQADDLVHKVIPKDSEYLRTYKVDGEPYIYYHSDELSRLFPKGEFYNGKPGDFSVSYNYFRNGVQEIWLTLGKY